MARIKHHTKEELNAAAKAAQDGGERERDALCRMMRPYVVAVVRRVRGDYRWSERLEMEQVGYVGVLIALSKFDPDNGAKFSTFAWPHVLHEVNYWLAQNSGAVAMPKKAWQDAGKAERALYEVDPQKHPSEFASDDYATPSAEAAVRARLAPYEIDPEQDVRHSASAEDDFLSEHDSPEAYVSGLVEQFRSDYFEAEEVLSAEAPVTYQELAYWVDEWVTDRGLPPEAAEWLTEAAQA